METNSMPPAEQTGARRPAPLGRCLTTAARILMGVTFVVFGLNGFLQPAETGA